MSKELSKTEEITFDAEFEKLLQSGDRHACAMCRNHIINMLELRKQAKNMIVQIDENRRYTIQEVGYAKTKRIVLTIFLWALVALNIWVVVDHFMAGRYLLSVVMLIFAVLNIFNACRFTFESTILSIVKKIVETTDVEVLIRNINYDKFSPYQELFRQISSDNEEILIAKKSALDQTLGF